MKKVKRYIFENLNKLQASFSDFVFVNVWARYAKYTDNPIPEIKNINPVFPFTIIEIEFSTKHIQYSKMYFRVVSSPLTTESIGTPASP